MSGSIFRRWLVGWMGVIWCAGMATQIAAEVVPGALFSDRMVLQHGRPVAVWGTAAAGEAVSVALMQDGRELSSAKTVAGEDGRWRVKLGALAPGGPFELTMAGTNTRVVKDVLVGEVWLASGQSNMNMLVRPNLPWSAGALEYEKEIASSANDQLRMFDVDVNYATEPAADVKGQWKAAGPETTGGFSATAYFFARELQRELGMPVGVITSAVGSTGAGAWTPRATLEADVELAEMVAAYEQRLKQYPAEMASWPGRLAEWEKTRDAAVAAGKEPPAKLTTPKDPKKSTGSPFLLYNGMIDPLAGYGVRGVIWYQGEGDSRYPARYQKLLPAMIASWRARWGEEFPFYLVQLANHRARPAEPGKSNWAELRESQAKIAASVPKSGMAVAIDLGEEKSIHPRNKQDVGRRLALVALGDTYGKPVVWRGPRYEAAEFGGGEARVKLVGAEGGLSVKGDRPAGFAIAGADQKWHWAEARVDGNSVVVSSPAVPVPVAVRYGWAVNPGCNVYGATGLPLEPFRSDDWVSVPEYAE